MGKSFDYRRVELVDRERAIRGRRWPRGGRWLPVRIWWRQNLWLNSRLLSRGVICISLRWS